MKIISKYKDYYDSIQSYGIDNELIFVRKHKEIPYKTKFREPICNTEEIKVFEKLLKHISKLPGDYKYKKNSKIEKFFIIGFCGKLYLGMSKIIKMSNDIIIEESTITYDQNEITSCLSDTTYWFDVINKGNFSEYLKELKSLESDEIFLKINEPYFIIDHTLKNKTIHINGLLNDYAFYKVMDTYTTFNEISMYMSNILTFREDPNIDISDVQKAANHGFDKFSFRKDPGKIKRKKHR